MLIEAVELDSIILRQVNSERFFNEDFQGDIQTEIGVAKRLEAKTSEEFLSSVHFKIKAFDHSEEEKVLFNIECNFLLQYRLNEKLLNGLDNEEIGEAIELFVERNVPLNAWPYGREFISQMTTRMGLPSLVIGTYKYLPSQDGEEE